MQTMGNTFVPAVRALEDQRASEHIAVAAEILGRRMHDDIGTVFERTLQHRRGERVVANEHAAVRFCDSGQRLDIADLHAWIRRRFGPDQVDAGLAKSIECIEVGHVNRAHANAALRKKLRAEDAQTGVAIIRYRNMRTRLQ